MSGGFDLRLSGVDQMERLGRDLKAAGEKDLKRELMRAGREIGKPVKAEIAASAAATLPQRGGLAALIAKARIRVSTRLSGRSVGVSFIGKWSGHDLKGIDEGLVRHPVRGNPGRWVAQRITPGFWTKVFDTEAPRIAHEEFLKAVDEVARKLRNGG